MQIYSQLVPLALGNANGSAVAMGFFDGIHIGHRAVIEGAVQWARAHGASPAVFTFKLPTENKMKGKRLLSTEDKHALIERLGVEHYLCPDFEEIKAMTPEQFVLGIVRDCNAKALFCGENFTFGAKAAGNPELLRKLCAPLGVEVVVLPMARFEEKPVSSTRIRTALEGATDTEFTVKGVVTLVDGQNYYLQDATGAICLRLAVRSDEIALGDTIIGTGKRAEFRGMAQLGSGTFVKSSGLTLNAKPTTIAALTADDVCTYVQLKGLEITEIYDNNGQYANPNVTFKDADGKTIQLYKAVLPKNGDSWAFAVGDKW